ncbi:MAG: hypothetical protein KY464_18240 [Gemmatimonadetes bacterium]|nr:hypothetical protein [Gemmatimonadota bacterium]
MPLLKIRPFPLALLAVALLTASCGGGDSSGGAAGAPTTGGNATVAFRSDFDGFNPVTNSAQVTDEVIKYMLFTPIIQFDSAFNARPYLAERWELTDQNVTFHLRQGVTWHDGKPVTAEDVKFTFDLAKNPETGAGIIAANLGMVKSATVVDPQTIRFDFVAPHAQALEDFWWPPVPKHLLESVPPSQMAQAPFNQKPVGSGPFKFVSWQQGQTMTVEANTAFPAALGGRPRLDRVTFRVIPESTIRLTELVSGSIQADLFIPPSQAQQLESQGGVEILRSPSRSFVYMGWNNEREPFKDPVVRRALGMAINKPQMIQGLLRGFGSPAHGVIPPWSPMYTDLSQADRYDPAAAKQLLAQAGWRDTNGDGILDKGGRPLRFTLLTNASNQLLQDVATVIQQQLKTIGADAQIRTLEFQTLLQQHRARDYEAVLANWSWDYFRPDPTPLFSCAEARKESSPNRAGYCNPQADQLMETGLREADAGRAKSTWSQYSQIVQQDQPITPLYWSVDLTAVGPTLQGVSTDPRGQLVNVTQWWVGR